MANCNMTFLSPLLYAFREQDGSIILKWFVLNFGNLYTFSTNINKGVRKSVFCLTKQFIRKSIPIQR